ncbi:hypothetical protein FHS18_001187 [Paenibacillus phyllosphaerae]|uniref:Secreted protein n=1 Tax=Paenibacillus phyllosphaerae TaxID=274593 RepID=A0A7W5FLE6_9BACL|nr:hypothetical protein [Paenibacillus phyllosphaerae]MBB3109135.1 hypothetical protein [Paenibacillus phyllosphaerae]
MLRVIIGLACLLICSGCIKAGTNPNEEMERVIQSPGDRAVFGSVYGEGDDGEEQELAPRKLGTNKGNFRPPLGSTK